MLFRSTDFLEETSKQKAPCYFLLHRNSVTRRECCKPHVTKSISMSDLCSLAPAALRESQTHSGWKGPQEHTGTSLNTSWKQGWESLFHTRGSWYYIDHFLHTSPGVTMSSFHSLIQPGTFHTGLLWYNTASGYNHYWFWTFLGQKITRA